MPTLLLVTVTRPETQAVLKAFSKAANDPGVRQSIGDKTCYALGSLGGADVFMVQSEMGSATPGGALITVHKAIQALAPAAVIMVGIAFGLKPKDDQHPNDQELGHILVAKQIMAYEPQKRKGEHIMPRGDRVACSTLLLSKFRDGDLDWTGAKVWFGLLLSGEKLVADEQFRAELLALEPEAIGGEMEGAGLYAAASDAKTDWILVKAICDWADGNKHDAAQALAAENAARFVRHVLELGGWENVESKAKPEERKQVQLILEGNFAEFDESRQDDLIAVLTALLRVDANSIRLLQVYAGSIVVILEMPEIAAYRLRKMASDGNFRLRAAGILSIQLEGEQAVTSAPRPGVTRTGRKAKNAVSQGAAPQFTAQTRQGAIAQGSNNTVVGAGGVHVGGSVGGSVVTGTQIEQKAGQGSTQIGQAHDVNISTGPVYNIQGGVHAGRDVIQGDQTNITYPVIPIETMPQFSAALAGVQFQLTALLGQADITNTQRRNLQTAQEQVTQTAAETQKPQPDGRQIKQTLTEAKETLDLVSGSLKSAVGLGALLAGLIAAASKLFGA